ncbi:MAG: 5-formyltetrahydrofolate cyclo-ligase [Candidatus Dojkabacteria bacterium]|nr:MAG: 5-formyltetrahydrofolate cyclo-ligase [Candidatus Dojkabacteria bacterium]
MKKKILRKIYRQKRLLLRNNEIRDKSIKIFENLFNLALITKGSVVHVFIPIKKLNEVDTWIFINYVWNSNLDLTIVTSSVNYENLQISYFKLTGFNILRENKFGILEPVSGIQISPQDINFIVVPMLICDKLGNRVGYGKGIYDRILAECTNAKRVGINFFEPIDKVQGVTQFDVKLDYCVTPQKVYKF